MKSAISVTLAMSLLVAGLGLTLAITPSATAEVPPDCNQGTGINYEVGQHSGCLGRHCGGGGPQYQYYCNF